MNSQPDRPTAALPEPEREAPTDATAQLLDEISSALSQRHGPSVGDGEVIRVDARQGPDAAWLRARVGTDKRGWEMELFARGDGEALSGPLGLLVDWLDGALEEWVASGREAWVGLDWDARTLEDSALWVRGAYRDYEAEAMADELLRGE